MNKSEVRELVDALCGGDENAYHTLIEANHDILPALAEQFAHTADGTDRARILAVYWQHRVQSVIPFLASALNDEQPEVWKQAIDGLVAIGGEESRNVLKDYLSRIPSRDERSNWISEAIGQLQPRST